MPRPCSACSANPYRVWVGRESGAARACRAACWRTRTAGCSSCRSTPSPDSIRRGSACARTRASTASTSSSRCGRRIFRYAMCQQSGQVSDPCRCSCILASTGYVQCMRLAACTLQVVTASGVAVLVIKITRPCKGIWVGLQQRFIRTLWAELSGLLVRAGA